MNIRRLALFASTLIVGSTACGDGDVPPTHVIPSQPALAGQPPPEHVLPEHPKAFRVELSGGYCFGSCPSYDLSIDQDGYVSFVGEGCLVRPGVWERRVPKEDARAVYDALFATRYEQLNDRYEQEADGCSLITDAPTVTWKIVGDGKKKGLRHYMGCLGVDEDALDEVEALRPFVQEKARVLELMETDKNCLSASRRIPAASFRLSRNGSALGVLQVTAMYEAPRFFELRDCAGATLARGDARNQGGRLILLEEDRRTILLPADLGVAASILLELDPDASSALPTRARALRDDEDIGFELSVGTACDG